MDNRLDLALRDAPLPEGTVLVFGARPGALGGLPKAQVRAVQPFRPDHDALAAEGWQVAPRAEGPAAAAVVLVPRAKALARAWLAEAAAHVAPGGPIWVDGAKTHGIESVIKDLRARGLGGEATSKAHGKAMAFANPGPEALEDWRARPSHPAPGFIAWPGNFSADGIDRGSALLAEALPAHLPRRVADLGAGWGWLSAQVLARAGVERLDVIEADATALDAARANITDPRARFHWADATHITLDERPEAVVMNPPFHTDRTADPALGVAFIRAAAAMLTAGGTLWMVANRQLPYEAVLRAHFRHGEEVGGDGTFKVIRATGPSTKPLAPRG